MLLPSLYKHKLCLYFQEYQKCQSLLAFENVPRGSAMEVTWKAVVLNNSAPVLYIVQSRYSIGYHYSEQHATQWKQISQVCNCHSIQTNITLKYFSL